MSGAAAGARPAQSAGPRPSAARPVRVLLADASPVFRRGLLSVLHREPDIRIVGEVGDTAEAIAQSRALAPDIVLLDLALPPSSVDWGQARALLPNLRLCLLVADNATHPHEVAASLRQLGTPVNGYLARELPLADVAPALRAMYSGRPVLSPALAVSLMPALQSWSGESAGRPTGPAELGGLTERELDVLRLLAEGLPNRQVAERLFISENTVRNHVRHILDKLHLRSRTEAALYAVRQRVVELPAAPAISRRP